MTNQGTPSAWMVLLRSPSNPKNLRACGADDNSFQSAF
jgi:hypothetical protein